jgi:arginine/serine-rich splicing factor 4/5/6
MTGRVYIGRLAYSVRERDIERFFRGYGRIVDVLLKNGYGFVVSIALTLVGSLFYLLFISSPLQEFDDYRDADDAVYELNGKDLCGER